MKNIPIVLLLSLLLLSTSCTKVLIRAYGIKNPKPLTEVEVLQYAQRLGYGQYNIYTLDTSYGNMLERNYLISEISDSAQLKKVKAYKKQLHQMVQYLLFDKSGKLMTHIVNCDVGGFPTLNWNAYGSFNEFPVVTISKADTNLNISMLLPYFKTIGLDDSVNHFDYQCVVFWNRFMSRHSKKLVELSLENVKQAEKQGKKIKVYLVNNDNYFYNIAFKI